MKVENFMAPIIENLISAYPGFTPNLEYHRTGHPRPFLAYFPGLISRTNLPPVVVHLENDKTIKIATPETISVDKLPKQLNYQPSNPFDLASFGPTVKIPLGYQVLGRSGDKGANVNCGFFPRGQTEEEWDWFRSFMTTDRIHSLLGKDSKAVERTERVEFPRIHAVHFVLIGLLSGGGGGGVSSTCRPDSLGKVRKLVHPELLTN